MRRVHTLPGLLSTGPAIESTGGHHTANARVLSFLQSDVINEIQNKVNPTLIDLTEKQIKQLEWDVMEKLKIKSEVEAVLKEDSQIALENLYNAFVRAVPSNNFDGFEETLHASFADTYKVTMTTKNSGRERDFIFFQVVLKLERTIGNNVLQAKTKHMVFVSSFESNDEKTQYSAMIGPAGYAIPKGEGLLNTVDIRIFGPDTPL
jgi:hypothetical protein